MIIALTGTEQKKAELKQRLSFNGKITEFNLLEQIPTCDLLIDLDFDNHPEYLLTYQSLHVPLLLSAVKIQLAALCYRWGIKFEKPVWGLNALNGFLNRNLWEMTALNPTHQLNFDSYAQQLGIKVKWVEDRVGMVSPRILFMIINEAYYTLQEGTASKADIDTGMKLGTAYPEGPFAWSEQIGLKDVVEVLEALYHDTHDERYKTCSLLKTTFYQQNIANIG